MGAGCASAELVGFPKMGAVVEADVFGVVSTGFPKMGAGCAGIAGLSCGEEFAGFPKTEDGCVGGAAADVGFSEESAGFPKMGAGFGGTTDADGWLCLDEKGLEVVSGGCKLEGFEVNPPKGTGLFSCAGEHDPEGSGEDTVGLGTVPAMSLGKSVCLTKSPSSSS